MLTPTRILGAVERELSSLSRRTRALRDHRPRVAYLGGQGAGNLGDDAIFSAAADLLERVRLESLMDPRRERRLRLLGLSGPQYFRSVILGGGTFINPQALEPIQLALELGLPCWAFGTGAGSSGFNLPRTTDLAPWSGLLPRFQGVGVRGPLSLERVEALGVRGAEVVGDLALVHARESLPEPPAGARAFCVNVLAGRSGHVDVFAQEKLVGLERASRALIGRGWKPVLVAMDVSDLPPLQTLAERLGVSPSEVHLPRSVGEFFSLAAPCAFTVGVRLHAIVLSTCAGVPALMLGYRDKCLDFMQSLELEEWHVDIESESEAIEAKVMALSDAALAVRSRYLEAARHFRSRIQMFSARIVEATA